MDDERFPIVDPWKSYAPPAFFDFMSADYLPISAAGSGKSILWYALFHLLRSYDAYIIDKLFDHREDQADAKDQISVNWVPLL